MSKTQRMAMRYRAGFANVAPLIATATGTAEWWSCAALTPPYELVDNAGLVLAIRLCRFESKHAAVVLEELALLRKEVSDLCLRIDRPLFEDALRQRSMHMHPAVVFEAK